MATSSAASALDGSSDEVLAKYVVLSSGDMFAESVTLSQRSGLRAEGEREIVGDCEACTATLSRLFGMFDDCGMCTATLSRLFGMFDDCGMCTATLSGLLGIFDDCGMCTATSSGRTVGQSVSIAKISVPITAATRSRNTEARLLGFVLGLGLGLGLGHGYAFECTEPLTS